MRTPKALTVGLLAILVSLASFPAWSHDPDTPEGEAAVEAFMADHEAAVRDAAVTGAVVPCVDGMAGNYPCNNVDLLSVLPLNSIGGGNGNDIWGWTDTTTGKEYAIMGRTNGTAFVDVSSPTDPVYLGNLPSHGGGSSSWRDIKVYRNHAFVVADMITGHGMQVFDLTRLRSVTSPQTFTEDAHYSKFGPAHNIAINEDTGFAYAIGSNTCSGGPHMVNIQTPTSPTEAGCVSGDGYTHDTQCVTYAGPDADYTGKEICMNSNEDTVTVVDVTDKATPRQISRTGYTAAEYTHQGWFTEDQRYFLVDDELDEQRNSTDKRTKTYVFNAADLDRPVLIGTYSAPVNSIDHNQYVKGNYSYQANYQSGLRILDLANVADGQLTEAGFFDIYPSGNSANFNGAWSVYPYFASGTVIISGIEQGLVVVKPNLSSASFSLGASPASGSVAQGSTATTTVTTATVSGSAQSVSLSASGLPSGATATFDPATVTSGGSSTLRIATSASTPAGTYPVTIKGTGTSGSKTATYSLTVTSAGGGGCSTTNGTDVAITDNATVSSSITISGCTGNASATATVPVNIQHTYIGDLKVDLVAPDGSVYILHNRSGGSADNINQTYTVNLSSEVANGTWKLQVNDNASQDTGKIDTWTLNTGGGGVTPPPACGGTNGTDVAITDNATVSSSIAVTGCTGTASATSKVAVNIQHTYIGDLKVDLVAPDGSVYTLHNRSGGSTDNINQTYTVNLSSETKNGTWKLQVNDNASQDTGKIDTWTLTL
jgi:choice-of-anchor B domain-containing protein